MSATQQKKITDFVKAKKPIQRKSKMNQQLQKYIEKEKDKPLRSIEDWCEELKSQSKDMVIYEETKQETQLQEYKPIKTKYATKQVKCEEGIAEPKQRKARKPKVLQVEEPLQLAVPILTEQANTTIDYINLESMGERKVVIAKTLQYDYFNIPIDWEAKDISIIDRRLYYKDMLIDCKATNQPRDRNTPLEVWIDFKVCDYSFYFQKPTM